MTFQGTTQTQRGEIHLWLPAMVTEWNCHVDRQKTPECHSWEAARGGGLGTDALFVWLSRATGRLLCETVCSRLYLCSSFFIILKFLFF